MALTRQEKIGIDQENVVIGNTRKGIIMKLRKVWDARFGFGVVVRENAEFVYVQFSGREYLRTYKKFLGEDSNLKDRGWIDIP